MIDSLKNSFDKITPDVINNFFGTLALNLILAVLFINTLRGIIAQAGWIGKDHKLARFIYDSANEKQLNNIVNAAEKQLKSIVNITEEQLKNIVDITLEETGVKNKNRELLVNMNKFFTVNPIDFDHYKYLEKLIFLLSKHIYKANDEIIYGKISPEKTKYYVNTMDASLNKEDNKLMCSLAWQLLTYDYEKSKPDFIVVPKMGNPAFAIEFAKEKGMLCLLRKAADDHSRAKYEKKGDITSPLFNLEGAYQLQLLAKQAKKLLYGVIFDCNCSGGSSLLETATEFNQIISDYNLNISPIDNAYVLFRADSENIDKKFSDKKINLTRYFDLTEDIKEMLYNLSLKIEENSNPYSENVIGDIDAIVADLTKKNLIKRFK